MSIYEIHTPCEVEMTRYRLEFDEDYYYHLDNNYPEDLEIMKQLEREEIVSYRVVKEVLPAHGISWVVKDCIGGILHECCVRADTILREVMIEYFGEQVKTGE